MEYYDKIFKEEAVKLSDEIGVKKAAELRRTNEILKNAFGFFATLKRRRGEALSNPYGTISYQIQNISLYIRISDFFYALLLFLDKLKKCIYPFKI